MSGIGLQTLSFDDLDRMAHALNSPAVSFIPLNEGAFRARLCRITVGGFEIRHIRAGPHLMHGVVRPGSVALHLLHRSAVPIRLNGAVNGQEDLGILPEGAPTDAAFPVEHDRIGFVADAEEATAIFERAGLDIPRHGHAARIRVATNRRDALARIVLDFADYAESMPRALSVPGLDLALAEEIRGHLIAALSGGGVQTSPPRAQEAAVRQVAQADAFLRAHIDRPIYMEEVCRALGTPPRSLHKSFVSVYGVSPFAYLKRRRLMLVHHALRQACPAVTLVKSVALAHGFWHLGRFASDYAAYFGEKPSETLAARPEGR